MSLGLCENWHGVLGGIKRGIEHQKARRRLNY